MGTNVRIFVVAGLLLAVALGLFVSPFASSEPDGLERVAIDEGFADAANDSATSDSPLADYGIDGNDDSRSGAISGVIGILVTFGLGTAVFGVLRVLRTDQADTDHEPATTA
ncbi:PDGLE domain-containing protein [Actinospongicola halichondriae]|uniref:PDGLE domain-containing protein n=1 Tax=Actinospongicola halichondriae TaxID=3236844 RepID=UPI003D4590FD